MGKGTCGSRDPKPFNLKYLGVGNEDLISNVFKERFEMIYQAFREKHPEIIIIGTAVRLTKLRLCGRWELGKKLNAVPILDELITKHPDGISIITIFTTGTIAQLQGLPGRVRSHLPGRPNNIETALAEALHIINMERNGDIVCMSSYAPLFCQRRVYPMEPRPDLFYQYGVKPTVGYWVQQLSGVNSGDEYIPNQISLSNSDKAVRNRIAMSVVRDSKTNELIVKMVNLLPVTVNSSIVLEEWV